MKDRSSMETCPWWSHLSSLSAGDRLVPSPEVQSTPQNSEQDSPTLFLKPQSFSHLQLALALAARFNIPVFYTVLPFKLYTFTAS